MQRPLAVLLLAAVVLTLPAVEPVQEQKFVIEKPAPGWSGERIVLPPKGFAPDLGLTGIEEILFAPGMFKADQKNFFTYVFLFALEPKPRLTPKVLSKELLTYYKGLSKARMGNPKLDTSKFTVKLESLKENGVTPKGAQDVKSYRAEVYWLEPFATKKMQTLHFELQTWKYRGSPFNYLFVCASPKKPGTPIWKTMRGIRAKVAVQSEEVLNTAQGVVEFHPINHATLVIGWGGKTIYVDPVGNADWYKSFAKPDVVLVTHVHGDHFRPAVLQAVTGPKTVLVAPPTLAEAMPADLRRQTLALASGEMTDKVGFKLEAVASYNLTPARKKFHPKGQGVGYVLTLGGKRVYLSGDTEGTPEMLALKEIDVAFLCMNLPYTMDVSAAARAVKAFKPKVVYPYHYRGQDVMKFKALVGDAAEVRLRNWYR